MTGRPVMPGADTPRRSGPLLCRTYRVVLLFTKPWGEWVPRPQWWIHVDLVGIQTYVFGSRRLKDGIGRSAIVDDLCSPKVLDNLRGDSGDVVADVSVLIAGAGSMTLMMPAAEGDVAGVIPERVTSVIGAYTRLVLEESASDRINPVAAAQLIADADDPAQRRDALADAGVLLRVARAATAPNLAGQAPAGVMRCAVTGQPAEQWQPTTASTMTPMSSEAVTARSRGNTWHREQTQDLLAAVDVAGAPVTLSTDIDQLGRSEHRSSHIAVIVMDVNDLGDKLSALTDTTTIAAAATLLREVSKGLVAHLVSSVAERLRVTSSGAAGGTVVTVAGHPERLAFTLAQAPDDGEPFVLPVRPWVTAGDDIVMICESRIAWWLADQAMTWLSAAPDADDGRARLRDLHTVFADGDHLSLTLGIGIAVVPLGYSLLAAHDVAHGLSDHAKVIRRTRRQDNAACHALDWHRGVSDLTTILSRRASPAVVSGMRPYLHDPHADDSRWRQLLEVLSPGRPDGLRSGRLGDPDTWAAHRGWIKQQLLAAATDPTDTEAISRAVATKIAREKVLRHSLCRPPEFLYAADTPTRRAAIDAIDLLDDHLDVHP